MNTRTGIDSVEELLSMLGTEGNNEDALYDLRDLAYKTQSGDAAQALASVMACQEYPRQERMAAAFLLHEIFEYIEDSVKELLLDSLEKALYETIVDSKAAAMLLQMPETLKKRSVEIFLTSAKGSDKVIKTRALNYLGYMKIPEAAEAVKTIHSLPKEPSTKEERREEIKKYALIRYYMIYGTEKSKEEILELDPNNFQADPSMFYEMVSSTFKVDSELLWNKTINEIIDAILEQWDGEYLNMDWP